MRKKIVGIIVCMLLILSTTTMVLFSDTVKVEASGGGPPSSQEIGLDFDFVWNMTDNFSKVIYRTDWSDENNIPKGRAWATAGENYTRDTILWPNMGVVDNPCGLTGYTNLSIGYISGPNGLDPDENPKQYSSKIVVTDYGLSIYNQDFCTFLIPP